MPTGKFVPPTDTSINITFFTNIFTGFQPQLANGSIVPLLVYAQSITQTIITFVHMTDIQRYGRFPEPVCCQLVALAVLSTDTVSPGAVLAFDLTDAAVACITGK